MTEEFKPLWQDRDCIKAIVDEKGFLAFSGKAKFIALGSENIFTNKDIVLWRPRYGYSWQYFEDARKLATMLDKDFTILMPDREESFPMAFKCDSYTGSNDHVYLILAPREIDHDLKIRAGGHEVDKHEEHIGSDAPAWTEPELDDLECK